MEVYSRLITACKVVAFAVWLFEVGRVVGRLGSPIFIETTGGGVKVGATCPTPKVRIDFVELIIRGETILSVNCLEGITAWETGGRGRAGETAVVCPLVPLRVFDSVDVEGLELAVLMVPSCISSDDHTSGGYPRGVDLLVFEPPGKGAMGGGGPKGAWGGYFLFMLSIKAAVSLQIGKLLSFAFEPLGAGISKEYPPSAPGDEEL